jgi:hypothetical protein
MNPKKSFKTSKAFRAISLMPSGLQHWPNHDQPFNPTDSEVIAWLIAQPSVQQYIFSKASSSGAIKFDKSIGCWIGTAHDYPKSINALSLLTE